MSAEQIPMSFHISRRRFLIVATAAAAGTFAHAADPAPSRKLVVGVMGLRRGSALITAILEIPDVEIAYVADVDQTAVANGLKLVAKANGPSKATGVQDFRRILDDRNVDALFVAAPDYLAHAGGDPHITGGQACRCREARQPQCPRKPADCRRRASAHHVVQMGNQGAVAHSSCLARKIRAKAAADPLLRCRCSVASAAENPLD